MSYLDLSDAALIAQCRVEAFRGPGPGGQKRNKTSSAVRIRHLPTGLSGQSDDSRSQQQNRRRALWRLRQRLALELRTPVLLDGYRPPQELGRLIASRGAAPGRRDAAYFAAISALLDLFSTLGCSVRDTAARLGISTAALSNILLADVKLGVAVNELRRERGLRLLR